MNNTVQVKLNSAPESYIRISVAAPEIEITKRTFVRTLTEDHLVSCRNALL
jgi:hypothetical protein